MQLTLRWLVLLSALMCVACAPLGAQESAAGWLDGVVTEPLHKHIDWQIDLYVGGQKLAHGASLPNEGGLFSIHGIKPGVYEVRVWTGFSDTGIRPQRLFGVVVKPGVRSVLPITLHEGNSLEEIGQPAVSTQQELAAGWLDGVVTDPLHKHIDRRVSTRLRHQEA